MSGSQESGDRYVVATLEALISDPSLLDSRLEPRVGLYRLLLQLWDSVNVDHDPPAGGDSRSLDAMMPRTRQVFLLTAMEGFVASEVAAIMETTEDDVRQLIDQAGREIASQIATRVLIIEDEPLIAMDLRELVEDLGHEVTAVARTHEAARAAVEQERPGLVLADIQLADGSSGLDAVNEMLGKFDVPVVFITAYPERLLTGERPEPAFLITKPFQTDYVKAIISQALFFDTRAGKGKRGA